MAGQLSANVGRDLGRDTPAASLEASLAASQPSWKQEIVASIAPNREVGEHKSGRLNTLRISTCKINILRHK